LPFWGRIMTIVVLVFPGVSSQQVIESCPPVSGWSLTGLRSLWKLISGYPRVLTRSCFDPMFQSFMGSCHLVYPRRLRSLRGRLERSLTRVPGPVWSFRNLWRLCAVFCDVWRPVLRPGGHRQDGPPSMRKRAIPTRSPQALFAAGGQRWYPDPAIGHDAIVYGIVTETSIRAAVFCRRVSCRACCLSLCS